MAFEFPQMNGEAVPAPPPPAPVPPQPKATDYSQRQLVAAIFQQGRLTPPMQRQLMSAAPEGVWRLSGCVRPYCQATGEAYPNATQDELVLWDDLAVEMARAPKVAEVVAAMAAVFADVYEEKRLSGLVDAAPQDETLKATLKAAQDKLGIVAPAPAPKVAPQPAVEVTPAPAAPAV